MFKSVRQHGMTIAIIVLIIIVNVFAYYQYTNNIDENLSEQTSSHLSSIIDETVECINVKIQERISTYEAVARFIGTSKDIKNKRNIEALEKQADDAGYTEFDIISEDGKGIGEDTQNYVYLDDTGFNKAIKGKTNIATARDDYGNVKGIKYYIPISNMGKNIGVLLIKSTGEQFTDSLDMEKLGSYGNVFVVQKDGTLLSKGNGLDEVSNIELIFQDEPKSAKKLISSMNIRNSGYVEYKSGSDKKYICYAQTDYNKWYMVSIVSAGSVEIYNEKITNEGKVFFYEIALLMALLVAYLVHTILSSNKMGEVNKKRYYIVSEHSDSIVIDYSNVKDTMYCNEKWKNIFGYDPEKNNVRENVKKYIYPEDLPVYEDKIGKLKESDGMQKFQIRIVDKDGNPKQCFVKMFAIKGKRGRIEKVLVVIDVLENYTE